MRQNVIDLQKFYASRLGQAASDMALRRLASLWPDLTGRELMAFGYGAPYVVPFSHTKRTVLAMPDGQGAVAVNGRNGGLSCLVEENRLPFPDAQFDNVLIVHGLEEAVDLYGLLGELWRVTKPEGRLVIIASNRAGLWARSDRSPFGAGRPFSRTQLRGVLRDARFEPVFWSGALFVPPVRRLTAPASVHFFEKVGETVWPGFSGLIMIEAIKRVHIDPRGKSVRRVSRPVFGGVPTGSTAARETRRDHNAP